MTEKVDDQVSWKDVDLMMAHVSEKDFAVKRLKQHVLRRLVQESIQKIQNELDVSSEEEGLDDIADVDGMDYDSDAQIIAPLGSNSLNNILAQGYQKSAASATANEQSDEANKKELQLTQAKKKRKTNNDFTPPNVKYEDLGGIDAHIDVIRELIEAPLTHPEIYKHLRIPPSRGVLLHGPPGCGKTILARAVAGELQVPFLQISAPEVVSGMSGESEKRLREIFTQAKELAPSIIFIDEIDAITPKRETAAREMERRIVAQLLTCMDDLNNYNLEESKTVIVIGATNRPDALDSALRRAGRFDREISLGIPDEKARMEILKVMTKDMKLAGDFDFKELAKCTPGYVGADLSSLATAAGVIAVNRVFGKLAEDTQMETSDLQNKSESNISRFLNKYKDPLNEEQLVHLAIEMGDFVEAMKKVQPSAKREGFATIPDVTWSDIGALSSVREELRMSIVEPIKNPELFAKVGIVNPSGVLLYGPPGCGKTLLAKAIANESHCNFLSVKGPELLNKFVGESERGVRQLFARARASEPCVIFFDELDALCPKRGMNSDNSSSERVVNQLLTELDGVEGRKRVYIIAATNRPDIIDRAMLRPGRFDKLVYVQLPDVAERAEILKTLSRKIAMDSDVSLSQIAEKCERFSGADLSALIREAGMSALKRALVDISLIDDASSLLISSNDFEQALQRCNPSVSERDLLQYQKLKSYIDGN
jgi:ribosome biogenesis ATPase